MERIVQRSSRTRSIKRTLVTVLVLNLTVAIAKLVVGFVSGSLSILADGLNSLLDASANIVGLVGMAIAARPPDPDHPYGHRRFEALTSLVIAGAMGLLVVQILQGTPGIVSRNAFNQKSLPSPSPSCWSRCS
jgi:cation diffusion facilitator family transporter